jgi:hypothetical protein
MANYSCGSSPLWLHYKIERKQKNTLHAVMCKYYWSYVVIILCTVQQASKQGAHGGWWCRKLHSWWAESSSVRPSRGMVCSRQSRSFQGVDLHGWPDGWTDGWWERWMNWCFTSRHPLLYVIIAPLLFTNGQVTRWKMQSRNRFRTG